MKAIIRYSDKHYVGLFDGDEWTDGTDLDAIMRFADDGYAQKFINTILPDCSPEEIGIVDFPTEPRPDPSIRVKPDTVHAFYVDDPGDWIVQGRRVDDDGMIFLCWASDKDTAHNLAGSIKELDLAIKADHQQVPYPTPPIKFVWQYESFGDVMEMAQSLGFDDDACEAELRQNTNGEYTPDVADALEESALDHIRENGYSPELIEG